MDVRKAPKIEREASGQFKKGVVNNPKGRPVGSKNKITLLRQALEYELRQQSAPFMPAILDKAMELALEGDRAMIRLLLEQAMSKAVAEDREVKEKLEINISGTPSPEINAITVIEAEPEESNNE